MSRYTILDYVERGSFHIIESSCGEQHFMDLFVDGSLDIPVITTKDELDQFCKSLIGKQVEIESHHPYISIATGVTIISKEQEDNHE